MVFRQSTDPQIDVVHITVQRSQLLLECRVGSDLGERRDLGQAVRRSGGVVVGQAVVSSALNVEGGEVEPSLSRCPEQEVLEAADDLRVDLFGPVRGEVLQDGVDPGFADQCGIEERILEQDRIANLVPLVVKEFDVISDHRVSHAESRCRELVRDAHIHVGLVPGVGPDRVRAEQRGEELVVGDRLDLGDHFESGLLEDLLIGECGVGLGNLARDPVMLAQEDDMNRGQLGVLVHPNVPRDEHRVLGGQQVPLAGFQLPSLKGPQRIGGGLTGAIDHRPIDVGSDVIHLLAGVRGALAGRGIPLGAAEGDGLCAGVRGVEQRVALRDRDGKRFLGGGTRRQAHVVVDELAPGIHEVGQPGLALGRSGLCGHGTADGPSAGAVGSCGRRDPVAVRGLDLPQQIAPRAAPVRMREVVPLPVE